MVRRKVTRTKVPNSSVGRKNGGRRDVPRPFLRWVGGKYQLARVLVEFAPSDASERVYHEPFLGGASLFFALQHPKARLSDLNGHLIECYKAIRDHPAEVSRALRRHMSKDDEDYYYRVRDRYNRADVGVSRAAMFLYLNRTCFNGVFRVNRNGEYNVPYGHKESPTFPSKSELLRVAGALKKAKLAAHGYVRAMKAAKSGEFVYLDPPYPPLNGTSFFTHYTPDRFGPVDQKALAEQVRLLDKRGCLFLLSNADTPLIRRLYRGFRIHPLSVTRFVTSSKTKHRVREVLVTNYSPKHKSKTERRRTAHQAEATPRRANTPAKRIASIRRMSPSDRVA